MPVSLPSNKGGSVGVSYHGPIDVESSDDECSMISPERKKGKAPTTITPVPVQQRDHRPTPAPRVHEPSNSSSPMATMASQSHNDKPGDIPRTTPFRAPELRTPSKSANKPADTPDKLSTSLTAAFKKNLNKDGVSPTKGTGEKLGIIVVGDSDDDDEDVESVSASVRRSYSQSRSFTNSSYSSLNSFPSISSTSSFSLIGSSSNDSETSRLTSGPARVADIFDTPLSENVTTGRNPKVQPHSSNFKNLRPAQISIVVEQQNTDAAVARFAESSFCADLMQSVIAHCDVTQKLLEDNLIAWGTQYELARGVSAGAWTWVDVRTNVRKFQGKSADAAYRVWSVMLDQNNTSNQTIDLSLWNELDREQDAITENKLCGLGLNKNKQNWFGGQIQQPARLTGEGGNYKIVLDPMEKCRSHRFARYYGSRRFLQVRISEEILTKDNAKVRKFFARRFVLCGRIFVPFHCKEGSVYLVETDQNCGRLTQQWCGDQYRIPFHTFINWHNPLTEDKNYNQTITKYAMRFAIGLSNSVPALEFEADNIIFIDDITAEDWPKGKPNPPADKLMTDGCGFMNHAALHAIVKHIGYDSIPAGVQGRIAGAKGFWILHPEDTSDDPKIWIRTSQNKIQYSSLDRSHRIFDLLAPSHPSASTYITLQSIVNLFNNGVPSETLIRLMEEGLEEEVSPLMDWDRPHAMVFLWDAINKCGNVAGSRTQRLSASLSRALGFKERDLGKDNEGINSQATDFKTSDDSSTSYTGRNKYSDAPLGLPEIAAELVQSGFHPAELQFLFDKVQYIVKNLIKSSVEKYRIPIPKSVGAYIIPDPIGILKEGEVFYRFSKPRKDPSTGMLLDALEGEVLVGRYPITLPSDMKKVTARYYRELDKWTDVLIVSTKGTRSLANELADGDMDGDQTAIVYDPEIVTPFKNTPLVEKPEDFMNANFESKSTIESVKGFCCNHHPSPETSEAFMNHLLANLADSPVGLYSMMHKNATVAYGYHDPRTIRLAFIFTTLLDASKTGHRLREGIRDRDLRMYGGSSPEMAAMISSSSSRDILGLLKAAAIKKGEELFNRYQAKKPVKDDNQDKDLRRPYVDAVNYANQAKEVHKITAFLDELFKIRKHVYAARTLFNSACGQSASMREKQSPVKGAKSFKKPKGENFMLECAKAYSEPIEGIILFAANLEQIKASLAYQESPNFAFTVAFRELCHIKATSSLGGHAPTTRIFDDAKTISSSFLRALKVVDAGNLYS